MGATVEFVRAWQSSAANARFDQTGVERRTQTGAVRHVQAGVSVAGGARASVSAVGSQGSLVELVPTSAAGGAVASVVAVVSHGSSVTLVSAGVATVRGVS